MKKQGIQVISKKVVRQLRPSQIQFSTANAREKTIQ